MQPILITNSRMKAKRLCNRLHRYQYVLGYRARSHGTGLDWGTVMHSGLEAWWLSFGAGLPDQALENALLALGKARAKSGLDDVEFAKAELVMMAYHARWAPDMDAYEVIFVEKKFEAPLPTPTGRRAKGLALAGKLDALVRRRADGLIFVVEHKTTTSDLSPGAPYWSRLRMDSQISVYHDGALALGYEVAGCLYDVIVKPKQRPYQATPVESRKFTKEGVLYKNQRAEDETLDEFRARMAEAIAENPYAFFGRSEIVRLESELREARLDTYETARDIAVAIRLDAPGARNADACFKFNRACDFYDVCSGAASIDDAERFERLTDVHPELSNDTDADA